MPMAANTSETVPATIKRALMIRFFFGFTFGSGQVVFSGKLGLFLVRGKLP